jgi:uncharacterized membrane protein YgcG
MPQNTKFSAAIAPFCVSKLELFNSAATGSTAKLPFNSTNRSFKHSKLILDFSCVMCFLFVTIFIPWIVSMPADTKIALANSPTKDIFNPVLPDFRDSARIEMECLGNQWKQPIVMRGGNGGGGGGGGSSSSSSSNSSSSSSNNNNMY